MAEPDRLHQINLGYSPEEDRMLLRINTTGKTEYRLWLTRRYVKMLWKLLTKSVESLPDVRAQAAPETRQAVKSFQREEARQTADYSKDFEDSEAKRPLGETASLLTGVRATAGEKGTQLTLQTKDGRAINLNLEKKLLYSLCDLLISSTTQAKWNLDLKADETPAAAEPEQDGPVH
ncbi:MAG: hypothetical protein HOM52_10430 [Rhodospirillaceae bacterium]|jgi:hypothetical protein|nr:hypothetical protein [Rhodospirillaceae bacterium]MBT3628377.1 hypothetical protein [Rhodospirillaceae bacterium]MBT3928708.1 hypothetical protein [Rhodospirillaceae bacterium]MBT4426977.1 hypothetical protein [Rhodospirillaceae bacterium]MBT5038916.1 hypothetical protein [Rhodospirillaceae bacterium]